MLKSIKLFCIFIVISVKSQSQIYDCDSAYLKVINMVESNYAGFNDKVNIVNLHNYKTTIKKIQERRDLSCIEKLDLYLSFFKDNHLKIILDSGMNYLKEIGKNYPPISKYKLKEFFSSQNEKIIIFKKNKKYYAYKENEKKNKMNLFFIVHKIKNEKNERNGFYINSYQQIIPSNIDIDLERVCINNTNFYYKNKSSKKEVSQKFIYSNINKDVGYIKLSTFNSYFKKEIDKLILENDSLIQQLKVLIIDIRDNAGGSILSFKKLLKYIYDKPIVYLGGAYFASDDNIEIYEKYFNLSKENLTVKQIEEEQVFIDSLKKNKGTFYKPNIDTFVLKQKVEKPEKVVFLVNKGTGSASEMLLMMASQSSKTVIAGVNTMGSTDYLEPQLFRIFNNHYFLNIPWVRSYNNILKRKNDNIGIAPDIDLKNIQNEKWVDKVLTKIK